MYSELKKELYTFAPVGYIGKVLLLCCAYLEYMLLKSTRKFLDFNKSLNKKDEKLVMHIDYFNNI